MYMQQQCNSLSILSVWDWTQSCQTSVVLQPRRRFICTQYIPGCLLIYTHLLNYVQITRSTLRSSEERQHGEGTTSPPLYTDHLRHRATLHHPTKQHRTDLTISFQGQAEVSLRSKGHNIPAKLTFIFFSDNYGSTNNTECISLLQWPAN